MKEQAQVELMPNQRTPSVVFLPGRASGHDIALLYFVSKSTCSITAGYGVQLTVA